MKIIVWLGNPWVEYNKTRHNIWFIMLDRFVESNNFSKFSFDKKYNAEISNNDIEWQKIFFCKPQTYMNLSWNSVATLANFYKIESKNILILHDEIDLPTAKILYKFGWATAGHNGLKSIVSKIGNQDFARIRIWVDRPVNSDFVSQRVLSSFKVDEKEKLEDSYPQIEEMIWEFIRN